MEKLTQPSGDALDWTICGLIAQCAKATPHRMAIIDGHQQIDYQQLLQRASEVAGELAHRGVTSGSLVGVCMQRSWELIATLLGVMQAGCAYVPLDPAYPQERIQYMLEHSKAAAAITDAASSASLCQGVSELIEMDQVGRHANHSDHSVTHGLAYVIYTSGSTGRPKGVAIEHRGLVVLRQSMRERFSDEDLRGMLAAASVCFDTSVMEIMGTLSLGGTIILAKNALELPKLPAKDQVRTCVMVASAMQALLATEDLPQGIRCVVFGGEALKRSLVEQIYALREDLRVLNAYGPTEDTVYSTIAEISRGTQIVTIGQSVPQSRAYILDDQMQPVPTGESGELYLAGDKLARGYLYDDALTKERFIALEPTSQIPDKRLYKTGDLCRKTANGEIEFMGRVDQQVKVRGYRIELGEVESTLELMPGIEAAAAAAVEVGSGQKILAAYVVSKDQSVTEAEIKAGLSARLPQYMVPQAVRFLDELPLLPNDKLDRKQLMTLGLTATSDHAATALPPGSPTHHEAKDRIFSIIRQEVVSLLHLGDPAQVSPGRSFVDLGLDSLTTLELSSRLTRLLGQQVSPDAIFEHPTPGALIQYLSEHASNSAPSVPINRTDTLASFQTHLRSSHPTFQAAKAQAWNANDKSKLVQEVLQMVNDDRRNPYSKVLRTGSATRGIVGDAYNDEEQEAIIWTTNLYLGLNRDQEVMEEASLALSRFGTGMGTSAAASGMTNQHLDFEAEFADLVGKPSACLFPTGYTANVGAVAGLLGRNDVVVIDQLCHASIVDGARLCGAQVRTFRHNDAKDLAAVLETEVSPYRTVLVVMEGVYSMGEGAAPVAEIVRTAKSFDALVLVDEAHSFGFYGAGGAGICAAQGVTAEVDFIMTTLSKALGSLGGVVAASQEHVDLLKSASRAYIFQASVSPADMAAALTALRRLRADEALRERLWDTTRYMRRQFEEAGYDLGTGDGPIVTPHFSDKDKLYGIVQNLYQKGIQTSAVTYPIVESGRGRLRLICSAAHTREDVDKTLAALIQADQEVEQQLAGSRESPTETKVNPVDLEVWAHTFSAYLNRYFAEASGAQPDLAISIQMADGTTALTLVIRDGEVSCDEVKTPDLPACSLLLTERAMTVALQNADVQALLRGIGRETCILHGQTEPFIWLIGRLVEQRRTMAPCEKDELNLSEEWLG